MGGHRTGDSDLEKVKALLELARSLQEHLPSLIDSPSINALVQRLSEAAQTASCVVPRSALKKRSGVELASRARELFNLCIATQRSQSADMPPIRAKLLLQSRLLAFLMTHLALWTGEEGLDIEMGDVELLFSMAFKVARLFFDDEDYGSTVIVLQKAAEYTLLFPRLRPSLNPEELGLTHRLEAEYLILRTALALKESRIDVAEHMYAKVEQLRASLDPTLAENLAEVLFDTGKRYLTNNQFSTATRWLGRAYEAINTPALDRLSRRAAELRLIIGGAFVNALLSTEEPQDFETASNIVQSISSEVGETPVVLVLRLEVLQRSRPGVFDKEAYATCILGLVRSFNHSEPYYRLIEKHIWQLFQLDQELGCDSADEWLKTRIANCERDAWIERAVLRRLSMSVRQISTPTALDSVTNVLVDVCVLRGKPLKASTAAAAHTQGLEGLAKAGTNNPTFLYACILDAQKHGDDLCAMGDDATATSGPTPMVERQLVEELCQIFEHAVEDIKRAPKDSQGDLLYTVKELHWFCKNSYNLGISRLGSWDLDHIIRMMQVGLAVREYYPSDIPTQEADDIRLRSTLSHFVVASAMASVARTQDDVERQSQVYSSLRQHVVEFDTQIQEYVCLNEMDKLTSKDLYQKFASLLVFDLEAAVHLELFDELSEIVHKAKRCTSVETFKSMADCLLRGHLPPRDLYSALRQIINEIWNLERFDPARLAKYIRCLFQAVLPLESELGRQILQEAISKARASAESGFSFPPEEVQWLVTVAWNHAVDYWRLRNDKECKLWAQLVLELAQYAADGGLLSQQIREHYAKLELDAA
ncbi:conserved hypothetical protein [Verticillium alfalfae VaMs.102]|uniref:Protein ZIP4 homolog n=1 Tax=Verticillium alfalfae (strain VaMs.102 / ATCC MYA-4576 / FGSC 10136) TaxID=526221 RepID=C9SJS6_VERA1|nr:conserved hypothetical protein [Verticillium alfalfae VaMs.102]EEY19690.1 conserved hypothetical protein [Verticillium alfalfae VaMs.102]